MAREAGVKVGVRMGSSHGVWKEGASSHWVEE